MHEVEQEHKRVIAKQLVDQERKNGTANPTPFSKEGGSFDHSGRSKARLHQALEQRRYAPKNKEKLLIEGFLFRVFCWSHGFRLRNGDPMHAPGSRDPICLLSSSVSFACFLSSLLSELACPLMVLRSLSHAPT